MPLGLENPVVMVPESVHLTLAAPGLQAMVSQTDDRGARIQIFQLASVPRNGVLSITVSGLPTRGALGKTIATVLVAALVFAVVLGWRRTRVEKRPEKSRGRRDETLCRAGRSGTRTAGRWSRRCAARPATGRAGGGDRGG